MGNSEGVDLVRRAEQRGVRLGASRAHVIRVIGEMRRPFNASELLEAVERETPGVGRATVFRTLQLLCDIGLLEQVRLDDGQPVYIADHSDAHHHHLICIGCDTIVEIADCQVGRLAQVIAKDQGFQLTGHTFDIYGLCSECRKG